VNLGILAGLAAMTAYGAGSVLQALAARRTTLASELDVRLLGRLVTQAPYVAGLALDLIGFGFNVVALQSMPLFLVQCMIAGSVGVTAILSVPILKVRLGAIGVVAVLALMGGLVLLALSAEPGSAQVVTGAFAWALVGCAAALALLSAVSFRLPHRAAFFVLSALAGLAFAGVGVAARALVMPDPWWQVVTNPLAWALAAFGVLGMLLFASALQRGSVTVASALMFTIEVVLASIVGFVALGDVVPSGIALVLALVGVALSLGGAIVLSEFGEQPAESS
jgi:drug/metabolite transporter (DMT)-like permease